MNSTKINRRSFLGMLGWGLVALHIPLQACKQIIQPKAFEWTEDEIITLKHVLIHVWPISDGVPTIQDTNTLTFLQKVLKDPFLKASRRKIIRSGPKWVEEASQETYGHTFSDLNDENKEDVLRYIEEKANGSKFLNYLMNYHMEALLGDPVYGINLEEKGWKWLKHIPGQPRPKNNLIYSHYEQNV